MLGQVFRFLTTPLRPRTSRSRYRISNSTTSTRSRSSTTSTYVLLLFVPLLHNSTQTSDKGRKADQQQVEEMVEEGEKEGKKGADILTHFPSNDKSRSLARTYII